jgi:protein-tyrosine phosphatase
VQTPVRFERQIQFEGCFNFRDLGGYPALGGSWVRPHLLFRADGPHALTDADADGLRALDLATLIDLRTADEAIERGTYVSALDVIVAYHLPLTDVLPDAEELPTWTEPTVVARRYREMLDGGADQVAEVLAILSDPSAYPAVFHCSAGKDRTGMIAAILLGILGVQDADIIADYTLSRDPMQRLLAHLRATFPDAGDRLDQVAPAMVAADAATMAEFIAGLRNDFGSFDGYAASLGVGSAPRFIRAALLA